jgi:DNA-binding transcriptional LysR family regulator
MEPFSFDQLRVFLAVVDHGSFSGAARNLRRAQSAVSYAIANLEGQLRVSLFQRFNQRPALTHAGRALLADARKVLLDVDALHARAAGLARGLESELQVGVGVMFPIPRLTSVLVDFETEFPTVPVRLHVDSPDPLARAVLDGRFAIGITAVPAETLHGLVREPLDPVEFVPVVAPLHPLAALTGPVSSSVLRDHLQLVFSDPGQSTGRHHAFIGTRMWQVADLAAKHGMLLAGLGWGNMPRHVVADDLAAGRLIELWPAEWTAGQNLLPMHVIYRADTALGPAGRWLVDRLKLGGVDTAPPADAAPRRAAG